MREIKFRAWDKAEKFMIEPFRLQNLSFKFASNQNHIYMQYTGLKDSNGKEIYEGDIVIRDKLNDKVGDRFTVTWDKKQAAFHLIDSDNKFRWGNICFMTEIIGNIYENTELIK